MSTENKQTYKILRETHKVSDKVKDNLKQFTREKKQILDQLKEGEKSIAELCTATQMKKDDMVFRLMTLLKYGFVQISRVDDMDEYYYYKLKNNE
mgnify:CR=1 FL=1